MNGVRPTLCQNDPYMKPFRFFGTIWHFEMHKNSTKHKNDNITITPEGSLCLDLPGRVAQSVGHLTRKSGVLGSIPGLATYCRFSFRFFKKGSCQLLAKVCARSTG